MGLRPSMKLLRVMKASLVCSLLVVLALGLGIAQNISGSPGAAPSTITPTQGLHSLQPVRAFPSIPLWSSEVLTYLGVFSPDATFHTTSRFTGTTGLLRAKAFCLRTIRRMANQTVLLPRRCCFPMSAWWRISSRPAHAEAAAQAPSRVAANSQPIVTYAYGRPSVLPAPRSCRHGFTAAPHRQRS